MLVNDVSLRNLIPNELAKGFGFFQSKPASAFSPVAVTPDELDGYWQDGKLHRPLLIQLNGKQFGAPNAGADMAFNFPQLIAHAAKTRVTGSRLDHRLWHGVEPGPCRGLGLHRRAADAGADRKWRAQNAIPQIRRPCQDRNEG